MAEGGELPKNDELESQHSEDTGSDELEAITDSQVLNYLNKLRQLENRDPISKLPEDMAKLKQTAKFEQ